MKYFLSTLVAILLIGCDLHIDSVYLGRSESAILDEFISWQPDRRHLTVNNYRTDGGFSRIDFDQVERHSMRGTISQRDSQGELNTGVILVSRVSNDESRAKIVMTDGSVLEEVIRRMP